MNILRASHIIFILLIFSLLPYVQEATAQETEDTCLLFVAHNIARGSGNFYLYFRFSDKKVSIEKGDCLEYEIYLMEGLPQNRGGVDIWFDEGRTPLRDASLHGRRAVDQNGIRAHGDGDLGRAVSTWYERRIPLDAVAGSKSNSWYLVSEGDPAGCYVQFVDNIRIRRADGTVIPIYENGEPPVKAFSSTQGYSKYSALELVERKLLNTPGPLRKKVDCIAAKGRLVARAEDLKQAAATVKKLHESAGKEFVFRAEAALQELENAVEDSKRFNALARKVERDLSRAGPFMKEFTGHLVGHAHIDFQWLWEWPETIQVCNNTFSQAVKFMEEYEGYTFSQSSPGLYQVTEERFPELFAKIRHYVKQGQWEIVGGRACEGDEHMISPESHARHLLYGQRYFRERFGKDANVGFEPDTFGHTAQMPQILRLGGLTSFYFCRGGDEVPLFWWEAMDGTRILSFNEAATGSWYNAGVGPTQVKEVSDFAREYKSRDCLWIYGVGNHGGGPTREHIESAMEIKKKPYTPAVRFSTAELFFNSVKKKVDLTCIPVLKKELNSDFRSGFYGTYTTHGDIKRWNRDAEALTESVEVVAAAAWLFGFPYPGETFRKNWEGITWNHHRDTLPGTSINASYNKSREMYEEILGASRRIGNEAAAFLASLTAGQKGSDQKKILVFNPLCWERDGLVKLEGNNEGLCAVDPEGVAAPIQVEEGTSFFMARGLPSMGYRTYTLRPDEGVKIRRRSLLKVGETYLENAFVRVEIDPKKGSISRLFYKEIGKEMLGSGGSRLEVFLERPHNMSAWVIGEFASSKARLKNHSAAVVEDGPVRAALRMTSGFSESLITQYVSITRGSPLVEVRLEVEWKEKGSRERPAPFLKVVTDCAVQDTHACYDVPFGVMERPKDGMEVPALKWGDLSSDTAGLSLLNDCKHGYSAKGDTLYLSLIRSSYSPDPEPDVGHHSIGYAFQPHRGTWREGATQKRAAEFNLPLWVSDLPETGKGILPEALSFFSHDSESVLVTALKKAEDDDGLVFRCYESMGIETDLTLTGFRPIKEAEAVDFVEDPLGSMDLEKGKLKDRLTPWRIRTYKLRLAP